MSRIRPRADNGPLPDVENQDEAAKEDFRALSELFEAEYEPIFRFCMARTASAQSAEDATAETFVDAARLFATGRGQLVDASWLRSVARNRVIDQWRASERHRRRIQRIAELPVNSPADQSDFDEERVLRALRGLPDRQRAALTLRYLDEWGVDEIADALDTSYQAAESLLARGRRGFIKAFGAER